jgi:predicted GNAT family acetyltransferase
MSNTAVQLDQDENGKGKFFMLEGNDKVAEMVFTERQGTLIVHHTEVSPKAEGKGLAKELLSAMVQYARDKKLQVVPLCAFVHAQFRRHPDQYRDIWTPEV